jgi:3-isopropylmalate/(R)-2-methylmalate dehydratase small subunit/methanogen homoaconitase small subunit
MFDDDLNTDVIHPPEFFSLDPEVVKRGLFHGFDPTLQSALRPGDVLIAGSNFGCGSSRETSVRSLKLNGIGCIVAVTFARIFFRNATNNGLPCVTFANPADKALIVSGEALEIDLDTLGLRTAGGHHIALTPPGEFIQTIWRAGGLLGLLR